MPGIGANGWRAQNLLRLPMATASLSERASRFVRDGQTRTLDLVGHDESEPAANRIAFTAPLARALIGAEVGDEVDFEGADEPLLITAISVLRGSNDPAENSSR